MNRERKFERNPTHFFSSKNRSKLVKYRSYKSYLNARYMNSKHKRITKRQWKKYGGFRRKCSCCDILLSKAKALYKMSSVYRAFCSLECFIQAFNSDSVYY